MKKEKIPFEVYAIITLSYISQNDLWGEISDNYDPENCNNEILTHKIEALKLAYDYNLIFIDWAVYWEGSPQGFIYWHDYNHKLESLILDYCHKRNKSFNF